MYSTLNLIIYSWKTNSTVNPTDSYNYCLFKFKFVCPMINRSLHYWLLFSILIPTKIVKKSLFSHLYNCAVDILSSNV